MCFIYTAISVTVLGAHCAPASLHEDIVPVKVSHNRTISWWGSGMISHCSSVHCCCIVQNGTGTHNVACLIWPYSEASQALGSQSVDAVTALLVTSHLYLCCCSAVGTGTLPICLILRFLSRYACSINPFPHARLRYIPLQQKLSQDSLNTHWWNWT